MARNLYSVTFSGTYTNAGGDIDLLELKPADDHPILLLGWAIYQAGGGNDVGDAQEEMLSIDVLHMTATVTDSNGSAVNANNIVNLNDPTGTAASFSAIGPGTTVATTTGTTRSPQFVGWNERVPYEYMAPTEQFGLGAKQTEAILIRGQTTPADDVSVRGTAWVLEF